MTFLEELGYLMLAAFIVGVLAICFAGYFA
jgi:hypothetical protein